MLDAANAAGELIFHWCALLLVVPLDSGADSALADVTRRIALHPVVLTSSCCCDRPCLNNYSFSSRCLRQRKSFRLQQVVGGGEQVPFTVDLLKSPQQETAQAPTLLYLAVHRPHDRLTARYQLHRRPAYLIVVVHSSGQHPVSSPRAVNRLWLRCVAAWAPGARHPAAGC